MTLKLEVASLRKDVAYFMSTYFTSLLDAVDDMDAPTTYDITLSTTRDVSMDDVATAELDEETNEKQI